jgi:glycosyltransferase involved in cell wall biosynthesis
MYPRITIGILNYRYDHFLPEAIKSALEQDYENKEILVVYNGLNGKTEIPCLDGVDRWYVLKDNILTYGGRNAVFEGATTEWVYMLDADDTIHPTTLTTLMNIAQNTNADIVIPSSCIFNLETVKYNNPYPYSSLIKKSVWKEIGGYEAVEDIIIEDWDFWIKIAKVNKYNVQTINSDLYFHRWHDLNESKTYSDPAVWSKIYSAIKQKHSDLYD